MNTYNYIISNDTANTNSVPLRRFSRTAEIYKMYSKKTIYDEYPIFIYDVHLYNFLLTSAHLRDNLQNSLEAPNITNFEFTSIFSINQIFKSKLYFNDAFKNSRVLIPFNIKGEEFYVAKGLITDKNFNPLIITTYTPTDITPGFLILYENMKIYVSKKVFSTDFLKNKNLYKLIHNDLLSELVKFPNPLIVKDDLNFLFNIQVDTSKRVSDLNIMAIDILNKYINII